MAHSYLDFRGNHIHLRDEHIYVLMSLLGKADQACSTSNELSLLFKWWQKESPRLAPGCIDIPFDTHLVDDADIDRCQQLLAEVDVTLRAYGDPISGDTLNQMVPSARFRFGDQVIAVYLDAVGKVRGLLEAGRSSIPPSDS